jgi:hypothetical protein
MSVNYVESGAWACRVVEEAFSTPDLRGRDFPRFGIAIRDDA